MQLSQGIFFDGFGVLSAEGRGIDSGCSCGGSSKTQLHMFSSSAGEGLAFPLAHLIKPAKVPVEGAKACWLIVFGPEAALAQHDIPEHVWASESRGTKGPYVALVRVLDCDRGPQRFPCPTRKLHGSPSDTIRLPYLLADRLDAWRLVPGAYSC